MFKTQKDRILEQILILSKLFELETSAEVRKAANAKIEELIKKL